MKKALITGITGQDGSYLAELLLSKGYQVHGIIRRASDLNTGRIDHLYQDPHEHEPTLLLHHGDLSDASSLANTLNRIKPDEIYNLGAQSHVRVSFDLPELTADITALGSLRLLEAVRYADWPVRYYQAGSSEMYGSAAEVPQSEQTPFSPRSPYALAKVFAHQLTVQYREAYELFACNGILFNHESPRRGPTFVTRKVTRALARILAGKQETVYLGNLQARRDWGYAPEYVEAMWLMLQRDIPDDYVVATGESHSVQEFVEAAFALAGLDWQRHVRLDQRYKRPLEVDLLRGDARKAHEQLGWAPRTRFYELVQIMVAADIKAEGLDPDDFIRHQDHAAATVVAEVAAGQ